MIFDFTTRHPWLSLLLSLIIAAPFLTFLPKVQTVENVDYFTPQDDPDVVFYKNFKEVFGSDEFFIIAFKENDIFQKEILEQLIEISDRLEDFEEIRDVISLANVDDIIGSEDLFTVQQFLEQISDDPEELETLKHNAVKNALYRHNLISVDATTTAIVVFPHDRPDDKNLRKHLIEKTLDLLKPYEQKGRKFHLAGMTVTNLRLSQYMKSDVAKFIPISYLIILLTILIIFRDLKITLFAFTNISICLGCTMGFIAVIGSTLNNVTSIVPSLIMALCLADSIHIFTHYIAVRRANGNNQESVRKTLIDVYKPCLLTTITTIAGFMSLRVSHLPPIQEFALIASMGIFLAFIFSFLFLPVLITLFPPALGTDPKGSNHLFDKTLDMLVRFNPRYNYPIVLIFAIAMISGGFFLTRINVETNLIDFFKPSTPLKLSLNFVEKNLSGVETINISVKGSHADVFKEPRNLKFLEDLQTFVAKIPYIDSTNSFVDFVKDMNESFHNENHVYYEIPESRQLVSQYMLMYDSEDVDDYINSYFDHARIVARTPKHGSRELKLIISTIEGYLKENTPKGFEARITGESFKVVNIVDDLVRGQIESISLAVLIISVLMFFVLKSFKLGMISLVPNIFPILLNFGIMGFFHIPLNTATALISAVAIGIAVDDTIHFLYQYKEELMISSDNKLAIRNAVLKKGNAIITTSVILLFGFGILTLSSFIPTIHFGILTALIMVSAMVGDLLLVPALLEILHPRIKAS